MPNISTVTDLVVAVNRYDRLSQTKESLETASRTLAGRGAPTSETDAEIAKIRTELDTNAAEIRSVPETIVSETRADLKKEWHRNEADRRTLQVLNRILDNT